MESRIHYYTALNYILESSLHKQLQWPLWTCIFSICMDLCILCSLFFSLLPVQNLPFIENMEKRIHSASMLLDANLGHCFVDGLEHRDTNAIYNCLRAYAAIDNTRSAEEIFRTNVVAPVIQRIIPHGPLAVATGSDELEGDYLQIKQSIDSDFKFLLEISFEGIDIATLFQSAWPNILLPLLFWNSVAIVSIEKVSCILSLCKSFIMDI